MKISHVISGILTAFLIAFISTALAAEVEDGGGGGGHTATTTEDELLSDLQIDGPNNWESTIEPTKPTFNELHDEANPSSQQYGFLDRVKRQIPFLSKWFGGSSSNSGDDRKKMSSNYNANSNRYVSGSIVAKPGPVLPMNATDRDGRFLSLFTVVRFDNTECLSLSGDNGTCYPSSECLRRGGSPNGKCAAGYGVCCVFSKSCGASTNQNCTYFTHNGYPTSYDGTGSCQLTIYKSSPDVCQFRLDFDSFNIAQPGTNGVCNNDQFIVSGSNSALPTICGTNSGNHMYIDVGKDNSPLTLSIVTSGPTYSRSWKIKISQIRCHSLRRSPEGCLQYYEGVSGVIRSYNFDFASGQQLSNQDYTACIRMERNFCGIRYRACTDSENLGNTNLQQNLRSRAFSLTGQSTTTVGTLVGADNCRTDWITIPCATNSGRVTQINGAVCQDRICGDVFNSEVGQNPAPVFSYSKPFRLTYHSDSNETNDSGNRGFCLNYIQQPCTPLQ